MLFGLIFLCAIADSVERRKAIAICIPLFSFYATAGRLNDPCLFSALLFLAGLRIGSMMPNGVAQMTAYSSKRIRATMATLKLSGCAISGILAALVGKDLIEAYGWSSVFLAAGLPVVMIRFMLKSMPKSMPVLMKQDGWQK
jgi:AAHS family benzoate transporter-like MFS transporter